MKFNRTPQVILTAILSLALTACGVQGQESSAVIIGQKGLIERLDPASVYATDAQEVMFQAYGSLFNTQPGELELKPDLAESGEFVSPTDFEVRLRSGLKFANGNQLSASDVKHSLDRMIAIDDPNGPQILLQYINEVVVDDELTFTIKVENEYDQTLVHVLSSVAALIVDEQSFPADRILTPEEVIESRGFSGPYLIEVFDPGVLISYKPNPEFQGIWGPPMNNGVIVKYFESANNLAIETKAGELDVAMVWRTFTPTTVADVLTNQDLRLIKSKGSVPLILTFRVDTQPYGSSVSGPDSDKARAIRQAFAHLIDRQAIAEIAYGGSVSPAFSAIPEDVVGHSEILKELYGDGSGAPSLEKARQVLESADLATPVKLRLMYSPDRYGEMSEVALNLLKDQVEKDGIFELEILTAEWSALREIRSAEEPGSDLFFLQWGPDFADPDNYLSPLFTSDGWLETGWRNQEFDNLVAEQVSISKQADRDMAIREIEKLLSNELPGIVIGMDGRSAVVKSGVKGVEDILDVTFKVRYSFITKG